MFLDNSDFKRKTSFILARRFGTRKHYKGVFLPGAGVALAWAVTAFLVSAMACLILCSIGPGVVSVNVELFLISLVMPAILLVCFALPCLASQYLGSLVTRVERLPVIVSTWVVFIIFFSNIIIQYDRWQF